MGLKFIDLFAGIGGFHHGIEQAFYANGGSERIIQEDTEGNKGKGLQSKKGKDISTKNGRISSSHSNGTNKRPLCVYSNEWDKYANSVYRRHYGECDNRDIRTVDAQTIPNHDLLCGGFPCQSFSIAGKRGGFDDTRGTLFFEIARIFKEKQPRLCLLENVKGLLSHDNGRTIKVILTTLTELGYDVEWQVLNSKNFGVPQNRERIFIIGHLRGTPRPEVFPIGESDERIIERTEQTAVNTLTAGGHSGGHHSSMTLISKTVRTGGRASPHGSKQNWDSYEFDGQIRRLTPIETERLQGFPDNWTQYGADGELISDTQRYKMCGNAVTTNVITEIAKRLI